MRKAVKMSDIAKRLSVSNVTVSKALADKEGVSEDLRAKIKQVAVELGYRYNSTAKSLKEGLTRNIGVLIPERFVEKKVSFYWALYQNVAQESLRLGYYSIMEVLKIDDEKNNRLPMILEDNKVDGIIMLGQFMQPYVVMMKSSCKSLVFMDSYDYHDDMDTVITDNFYGAYLLTDYLINLGHRDLAFVGNYKATSSIQDRYLGFLKAQIENDIPYRSDWIIPDREIDQPELHFTLPDSLPTAFVCNCDEVAYMVIKSIQQKGLHVPQDISVVGFDNYLISDISEPAITTVEVNMPMMARTAVELLVGKIHDKDYIHGRKLIPGKIIIKNSTRERAVT